jgi:hypothetical protein
LAIPMGGNDKSSLSTLLFIHFLLIFDLHLADDVLQGNINSGCCQVVSRPSSRPVPSQSPCHASSCFCPFKIIEKTKRKGK